MAMTTTHRRDRGRIVAGEFDGADNSFHIRFRARVPADGRAPLFQADFGAGDCPHAFDRLAHVPCAVLAIHPADDELGYGELAGGRIAGMVFRLSAHKPIHLSTPAATVKFALTRSAAFH